MIPYSDYKDSGVDWMGKIPSHWETRMLKYVFDPLNEKSETGEEELLSVLIQKGIVRRRDFLEEDSEHLSRSKSLVGYKKCFKGNLVNNIMKMGFCCLGISQYDGIVSPSYSVFKINNDYFEGYYDYLLKTELYVGQYRIRSKGIQDSRMRLYDDYFLSLHTHIPPIKEQKMIVSYLDIQTQKIDELIEKTEQKLKLLNEKRTSLINHCVTKGLNPDVKMKDSGVEWIGEIPIHWKVKPLKYISDYNQNSLGTDTPPDYELDYLEISDVNSVGKIGNPTHYTFSKSPSRCRRILKKNDIIISTVRTYLRSIGFIENEVQNLICSTGFCVLSPNDIIKPKLLFYLVRSEWFISNVISQSVGVSYPGIQTEKLMGIKILLPPTNEQTQIVEYLDEQTQKIDSIIEIETQRIELLKEYRQSIISEVVTGKIDVRDWKE